MKFEQALRNMVDINLQTSENHIIFNNDIIIDSENTKNSKIVALHNYRIIKTDSQKIIEKIRKHNIKETILERKYSKLEFNDHHLIRLKGFRVQPLQPSDIFNNDNTNVKFGFSEHWNNWNDFERDGTGIKIFYNNSVCGICFTGYVSIKSCEIAVFVEDTFKNLGIGSYLVNECVRLEYIKGRDVYFGCDSENSASIGILRKFGITSPKSYIIAF